MSRKGDPFNFDEIYSKIGAENMVKKPMAETKKPVEHGTVSTEGLGINVVSPASKAVSTTNVSLLHDLESLAATSSRQPQISVYKPAVPPSNSTAQPKAPVIKGALQPSGIDDFFGSSKNAATTTSSTKSIQSESQPQDESEDPFAAFDAVDGALPAVPAMTAPPTASGMPSKNGFSSTDNLLGVEEGLAGGSYRLGRNHLVSQTLCFPVAFDSPSDTSHHPAQSVVSDQRPKPSSQDTQLPPYPAVPSAPLPQYQAPKKQYQQQEVPHQAYHGTARGRMWEEDHYDSNPPSKLPASISTLSPQSDEGRPAASFAFGATATSPPLQQGRDTSYSTAAAESSSPVAAAAAPSQPKASGFGGFLKDLSKKAVKAAQAGLQSLEAALDQGSSVSQPQTNVNNKYPVTRRRGDPMYQDHSFDGQPENAQFTAGRHARTSAPSSWPAGGDSEERRRHGADNGEEEEEGAAKALELALRVMELPVEVRADALAHLAPAVRMRVEDVLRDQALLEAEAEQEQAMRGDGLDEVVCTRVFDPYQPVPVKSSGAGHEGGSKAGAHTRTQQPAAQIAAFVDFSVDEGGGGVQPQPEKATVPGQSFGAFVGDRTAAAAAVQADIFYRPDMMSCPAAAADLLGDFSTSTTATAGSAPSVKPGGSAGFAADLMSGMNGGTESFQNPASGSPPSQHAVAMGAAAAPQTAFKESLSGDLLGGFEERGHAASFHSSHSPSTQENDRNMTSVTTSVNDEMSDDFFSGGKTSTATSSTSVPATACRGAATAATSHCRAPTRPIAKVVDLIGDLGGLHDVDVSSHQQLYEEDEGVVGEPEVRKQLRAARLAEKHAKMKAALAEKQAVDDELVRKKEEQVQLKDRLGEVVNAWKNKHKGNIRGLLGSLQTVLWEGSGWVTLGMGDLLDANQVKKAYMKANLLVHPDKVRQKNGTAEQVAIADMVFDVLKDAWNVFKP
ncbi:hypothetical protein CEUSTIGMA_g7577.t1 [Chlamydomonas eustigma]|uniref:J domain-containing protein n=1 Tax=Chlamydomonas eustigma TaxID=1157962 RepID=A0A250XB74_9CHLO|nr:hypothetical protein CEUSTIGMA_g7577.t1 [Chlamydomonas eustigma]|eukprot:GAX80139.1 hypothetical protein CEUSTIGMA_g7577.t1 [Chlamydomonas eustigma]